MPKSCSAVNCTRRSVKGNGISFFKFPLKHPELLCKWILAMRRADWKPNQHSTICSAHFTNDCYQLRPGASHLLLKSDAVPSIFNFNEDIVKESPKRQDGRKPVKRCRRQTQIARLVLHEHGYSIIDGSNQNANCLKRRRCNKKKLLSSDTIQDQIVSPARVPEDASVDSILELPDPTTSISGVTPEHHVGQTSSHPITDDYEIIPKAAEPQSVVQTSNEASNDLLEEVLEALEQECPEDSVLLHNRHCTSVEVVPESPTISKSRPVIRYTTKVVADGKELECSLKEFKLQRRVRALQQDIRRMNLKVKNVTEQMYELRKERNAAEATLTMVHYNFGGMAQEIFKNQMRNGKVAKGAERYSQAIKEFALLLYGHSPPAYEYLGGIFRLPHLSCIKDYSSSIKIPEDVVLLDYYQNLATAEVIDSYQLHIPSDSCCTVENIC